MLYELHVTVDGPCSKRRTWQQTCEATGSKPLLIELHGTPSANVQMMNAQTIECDPMYVMGGWVSERKAAVSDAFRVVRSKLEVPLDKGFVAYPNALYHECHVKALVKPGDVDVFIGQAKLSGWVISRNLFFANLAGYEKWYLTQRRYDMHALQAANEFCDAWADLRPRLAGVAAARMEMESVIGDTNPDLDAGWSA